MGNVIEVQVKYISSVEAAIFAEQSRSSEYERYPASNNWSAKLA